MKFTNGYWLTQPGVKALYARQDYEIAVTRDGKGIEILAPAASVRGRADTLNLPTFDVTITSPARGVIRIRARHWDGQNDIPGFPLNGDQPDKQNYIHVTQSGNTDGEVGSDGSFISLSSGDLTVTAIKGEPWNLSFTSRGAELTHSSGKSLAHFTLNPEATVTSSPVGEFGATPTSKAYDESPTFMSIQLALAVDELVYGFGERFGAFVKNGQSIDIWNADGGTSSEQAYKNIPFYMTTQGYGILVNNRGHVSFEVGSENTEAVQFSVPGETLDFCIIDGPSPKQILSRYTALVGRPAKVPAWSYGLWLTTSFTTQYDHKTINSMIDGMCDRGIPLSVFHYDCYWMREFRWMDFTWDSRFFSDIEGTLAHLKGRGLHICAWVNPYIGQRSKLFQEARREGYLVRKSQGDIWQTDFWQAGMGLVDFTNPSARQWFKTKIKHLLSQGIDAIKTDFGERIPSHVSWYDGSSGQGMHNWYTQLYNQTVFEALEETYGKGQAVLYARSATVGGQRQPVHWGGDCESTFNGMAQSLRGGLSLSSSGFGFWSHDIGGFEGAIPDSAVYKRWVAFGLLSSHSRMHGSTVYRVPWVFDEADKKKGIINSSSQTAVAVVRKFTLLKLSLMPYLYHVGLLPAEEGIPVMRSMFMEFPEDRTARMLGTEYMLGPSLLVAPVFTYSGDVNYYLPRGRWTNWFTGEIADGGRWRTENHPFDSIPLWVRQESIIVTQPRAKTPDYDYTVNPLVSVFEIGDNPVIATVTNCLDGKKITFTAQRSDGKTIIVTRSDGNQFTARLGSCGKIIQSSGGKVILR